MATFPYLPGGFGGPHLGGSYWGPPSIPGGEPVPLSAPLQTFFWTSADGEGLAVQHFFSGGYLVSDLEPSLGAPGGETITERAPFQDGTTALRAEVVPRDISFGLKLFSADPVDFKARKELVGRIFSPRRRNQAENRGILKLVIGSEIYEIEAIPEVATPTERGPAWQGYAIELYAPDPFFLGIQRNVALLEGPGITFPITFPLIFSGGDILVTVAGDVPVYPIIQIDGSASNPFVENLTTGKHIAFDAVVPFGQRLELDHGRKTIRFISLSDGVVVNQFEHRSPASEFWTLLPGENRIRYDISDGIASAIIKYRAKYQSVGLH